jgi:hypothetical protein
MLKKQKYFIKRRFLNLFILSNLTVYNEEKKPLFATRRSIDGENIRFYDYFSRNKLLFQIKIVKKITKNILGSGSMLYQVLDEGNFSIANIECNIDPMNMFAYANCKITDNNGLNLGQLVLKGTLYNYLLEDKIAAKLYFNGIFPLFNLNNEYVLDLSRMPERIDRRILLSLSTFLVAMDLRLGRFKSLSVVNKNNLESW